MLHGLWSPGSGLMLWWDPTAEPDPDALPSALRRWIDRPFRHRVTLTFPTDTEPSTLPAVAVAPADAAELLLDMPRRPGGRRRRPA
ncbi:hypothetical protein NJ76_30755, partial [Rhodococcus sp. IITR03]